MTLQSDPARPRILFKDGLTTMSPTKDSSKTRLRVDRDMYACTLQAHLTKPDNKGRDIRKSLNLIQKLFGTTGDIDFGQHHEVMLTSPDHNHCLRVRNFRDEIYWPFSIRSPKFSKGLYLHFKRVGTPQQLKKCVKSFNDAKVKEFILGSCLFGDTLKGIDQFGCSHPLTHPNHTIPHSSIIEKVETSMNWHPYETTMLQNIEILLPLIRATSYSREIKATIQLPTAEYIVQAIILLIRGQITRNAFDILTQTILLKARAFKKMLSDKVSSSEALINFKGPLDDLVLHKNGVGFEIRSFSRKLGLSLDYNTIKTSRLDSATLEKKILTCMVQALAKNSKSLSHRIAWNFVHDTFQKICSEKQQESLLSVNLLSYLVTIASVKVKHQNDERVCCCFPSQERHLLTQYKNYFAEYFGQVLGVLWLMPLATYTPVRNKIYFTHDKDQVLQKFIQKRGLDYATYYIAAQAKNDSHGKSFMRKKLLGLGLSTW